MAKLLRGTRAWRGNTGARTRPPARRFALSWTLSVAGALALMSLGLAEQAQAQFHGVSVGKTCDSPKCVGEKVNCDIVIGHNDDYGDTIEILEAWDVIDPVGLNIRVPATGDLDIIEVFGNTTAVVGGSLPVFIGPPDSTLQGLPGEPEPGVVVFGFLDPNDPRAYRIRANDPNPLCSQSSTVFVDLCDVPDAEGCCSVANVVQSAASATVDPLPDCFIEGLDVVCEESTADYCGPPGMQMYNWSISDCGATIVGPTDQQCLTAEFGQVGACTLTLTITDDNGCENEWSEVILVGPPADLDGDGIVDLDDLAQLVSNYGMTGASYEDGDIYPPASGDGAVDLQDLVELLVLYGTSCPQ